MNTQFPTVDTPTEWKFLATASTDSSTSEKASSHLKKISKGNASFIIFFLIQKKLSRSAGLIPLCIFTGIVHKSCILPLISPFLE